MPARNIPRRSGVPPVLLLLALLPTLWKMTLCPGLTEVCNWPACPENGGRSVIGVVVRGDMTGLASSRLCRIGVVWPEGTVAGVVIAATALVMGTAATEIEPTGAAAGAGVVCKHDIGI
mmetsp:Transcript_96280/g.171022  ORF Transcript_96280/g.171022 Transcript_96280/m.171022 type:complete len:119 (-) Transcript_96280:810-1166(-)